MAQIVEEVLVVKFSKIVKDTEAENTSIVSDDVQVSLEQVAQELVGSGIVVELLRA